MQFIFRDATFKGSHFKFLGRWPSKNLVEAAIKTSFLHKFHELLGIVENVPLDGFMKLWLYQHFLGMLSWPLLIQDFNRDFVKTQVTSPCGVYLGRWAGVFKSSMHAAFTAKLQVIKMHLVKHSSDPHVSALYDLRCKREEA